MQLQSLVRKYDQSMLDKYQEEAHLDEEYEQLQLEFENFMLAYNKEYAQYDQEVLQKEKAYKEQSEAEARMFCENMAARRIQRWWKRNKLDKTKDNPIASKRIPKKKQNSKKFVSFKKNLIVNERKKN